MIRRCTCRRVIICLVLFMLYARLSLYWFSNETKSNEGDHLTPGELHPYLRELIGLDELQSEKNPLERKVLESVDQFKLHSQQYVANKKEISEINADRDIPSNGEKRKDKDIETQKNMQTPTVNYKIYKVNKIALHTSTRKEGLMELKNGPTNGPARDSYTTEVSITTTERHKQTNERISLHKGKNDADTFSKSISTKTLQNVKTEKLAISSESSNFNAKQVEELSKAAGNRTSTGKLNVYTYHDIYTEKDNLNLYWNPLFPRFPRRGYFTTKLDDDEWLHYIARRFLGYLSTEKSAYYQFEFTSTSPLDFLLFNSTFSKDTILLRSGQFDITSPKANDFHGISKEVWLEQDKTYPIDVAHSCAAGGRFTMRWKQRGEADFAVIDSRHLSPLHGNDSVYNWQPESYAYTGGVPELRTKFLKDSRLYFGSRKQITAKSSKTGLQACPYTPTYLYSGKTIAMYYGQQYLKKEKIYPNDNANYKVEDGKMDRFLDEHTAKSVASDVFTSLNDASGGIYDLQSIVHVEENHDKKRYFVELDLKNKVDGELYRFSDYFLKAENDKKLCLPDGYSEWRHQVMVYLICAVKNQRQWFQYLLKSLEDLIARTGDRNLHLVVLDFNSTDGDLQSLLRRSKLNYTFVPMFGKFSKVMALNEGVRHIPRNDSIVFVMDLQLQIPDHIFDQARKHTIEGRMSYCPILIRLYYNEHPEYTNQTGKSVWMEIGYGMMSIYKSDWLKVGGMDEERYRYKWGGEDWEFVDRVVISRLELVHPRLPGFYHIHHSTLGTWDGTKMF